MVDCNDCTTITIPVGPIGPIGPDGNTGSTGVINLTGYTGVGAIPILTTETLLMSGKTMTLTGTALITLSAGFQCSVQGDSAYVGIQIKKNGVAQSFLMRQSTTNLWVSMYTQVTVSVIPTDVITAIAIHDGTTGTITTTNSSMIISII